MKHTTDSAKVIKTKQLLALQLTELLEHNRLKKITVNDVCKHAGISRSAFYLHFEDKFQLLKYCLHQEFTKWETETQNKSAEEAILYILDSILIRKNFYYANDNIRM